MTGAPEVTSLPTENRFADPDAAYSAIVDAHEGLSEAESAAFDARLVLILANVVGDLAILRAAIEAALKR